MKVSATPTALLRLVLRLGHTIRKVLPAQTSKVFGSQQTAYSSTISKVYVINLDREAGRWGRIENELRGIRDQSGKYLLGLTERHAAVDAREFSLDPAKDRDVDPYYTLADQLFVEPQPKTLPTRYELETPIRMSRSEVAVARSHIAVWRRVAQCPDDYVLILEDDVWFHPKFANQLDRVWEDVANSNTGNRDFDILYVSYMEATNGAPKTYISPYVFRPKRGLWFLSGYVLSKRGAEKLLRHLPCRGPIDLWINQKFSVLNVAATRRPYVRQRSDLHSTNSYSILPSLTAIGAIDSEGAALFPFRPTTAPVFSFGPPQSGQSSVAMALSMLGYRCCSDLDALPPQEVARLRKGIGGGVFNAYVNIGCLETMIDELRRGYPDAKFIVTGLSNGVFTQAVWSVPAGLEGADLVVLNTQDPKVWRTLCEHLSCAPPPCDFPIVEDLGKRRVLDAGLQERQVREVKRTRRDASPWIVEADHRGWSGIQVEPGAIGPRANEVKLIETYSRFDLPHWSVRSDTFSGNLAMFCPANVELHDARGATINVRRENRGARQYSAGALSSTAEFRFGRFEATFQASNVPGVIVGFFLHRNSPHQEIDIEITGNRPDRLLVNVFYNPGVVGAQFDYGYRGAPSHVELGFDASQAMHRYAIEWTPSEIQWFVDDQLVHRRVLWEPTPIPHLPMRLHFNTWPSRSAELAGRLSPRKLPAQAHLQSIHARTRIPSLIDDRH